MRIRGIIAVMASACALSACGDGRFFVRGELFRPEPAVPSLEDSKGEEAYNIVIIAEAVNEIPDGVVSLILTNGTTLSGEIDRVAGTFHWIYKFTPSSSLATLEESGSLEFNQNGLHRATYSEHAIYRNGNEKSYELDLEVDGNFIVLSGKDEQDADIDSVTTIAFDRIDVLDVWDLENVYRQEVSTTYFLTRATNVAISQEIVRDDATTPHATPDRFASFELYWDYSGVGNDVFNYSEGVTATHVSQFNSDGSSGEQLVYEDPRTTVSPDAAGTFDYLPDASGDGVYNEWYDDGSTWVAHYLFRSTYFDDVFWNYDDANNTLPTDLDGEIYYVPDRSGTGVYRRWDDGGPFEVCDYTFDTEDNVTELTCSQGMKASPLGRFRPEAVSSGIRPTAEFQ